MITKEPARDEAPAFEIRSIKWLNENRGLLDRPQRHFYSQIIWITGGCGRYRIDMENYALMANTIYFVPPGRVQRLSAESTLTGYVLSFSSDLLQLALASPSQPVSDELIASFSRVNIVPVQDPKTLNVLTNFLQEMIQELDEHRILRSEVLAGLLKVFLIYVRRMSLPMPKELASSKSLSLYNDFNMRVDKYFLTKRTVADYASELLVSPSYLSGVVKKVTGLSAGQLIQQRRVLEAKRLAIYSGETMKGIAYKLGFEDVSHFSKYFKNVAGVNFSDFKKNGTDGNALGPVIYLQAE